ncbi:MAG: MoxR family ATPase [Actinomycetota bacterium]|nr:MoxR family ATPase [Actinomycetota bacterium]
MAETPEHREHWAPGPHGPPPAPHRPRDEAGGRGGHLGSPPPPPPAADGAPAAGPVPSGPPPSTAPPVAAPTAPPASSPAPAGGDADAARRAVLAVRDEIAKVVVGQDGTVSGLVSSLLIGGHVLLEGVPGVAKTLLVKAMSAALDLRFSRVQFTPDLMPSDVTGQLVLDPSNRHFEFREGPLFTNVLLADEINRTPPKTQAALLEAMEERQVSVEGRSRALPRPFMVVATQNPVEHEGTYPLPEAQLDRFLFKLVVPYPNVGEEREVVKRHHVGAIPHDPVDAGVRPVAGPADLAEAAAQVERVRVDDVVVDYVVAVARATRDAPSVLLGASPRGAVALLNAAKAWAWLSGRPYVTPDEVKAVARPVLAHRLVVRPELELEGLDAARVLDTILGTVPVPR